MVAPFFEWIMNDEGWMTRGRAFVTVCIVVTRLLISVYHQFTSNASNFATKIPTFTYNLHQQTCKIADSTQKKNCQRQFHFSIFHFKFSILYLQRKIKGSPPWRCLLCSNLHVWQVGPLSINAMLPTSTFDSREVCIGVRNNTSRSRSRNVG